MIHYRGLRIKTCEGVYAPGDDTFLLADAIDSRHYERVLDLGTGTGILGLIAAASSDHVILADKSDKAVGCAKENARINDLTNVSFLRSDLFSSISGGFDLIIFNPPYLPTEMDETVDDVSLAWDGGRSGRDVIEGFILGVRGFLNPSGRFLMIGSSLSNYKRTVEKLKEMVFDVSIEGSRRFDFEELVVLRADYIS